MMVVMIEGARSRVNSREALHVKLWAGVDRRPSPATHLAGHNPGGVAFLGVISPPRHLITTHDQTTHNTSAG